VSLSRVGRTSRTAGDTAANSHRRKRLFSSTLVPTVRATRRLDMYDAHREVGFNHRRMVYGDGDLKLAKREKVRL